MLIVGAVPEPESAPTTVPTFDGSSSLGTVQRHGRLRVGVHWDLPGLAQTDPATGARSGLEIDLARLVAQAVFGGSLETASRYVEFVDLTSAERLDRLVENDVDLVIANLTETPERRRQVAFGGTYLLSHHSAVLGPSSPDVSSVDDLNDLTVAVVEGTTDVALLALAAPHAEARHFLTATDALQALGAGEVQAFWSSTANNIGYLHAAGGSLRQAPFRYGGEHWGIGIPQEKADMKPFVDEIVADTIDGGALTASLRQWLGRTAPSGSETAR